MKGKSILKTLKLEEVNFVLQAEQTNSQITN